MPVADTLAPWSLRDEVAVVRLDRPGRHNALVPELLRDLLHALDEKPVRHARALVLAAAGRSFSTGGDLLGFWQNRERIGDYARELVGLLNETILALAGHPAPVACAVQGQVTGGALGLLLASDHVIMAPGVSVRPWYATVGFSPDGGWTALLPAVVGAHCARDWLYRDLEHDARTCLDLGLAHELADDALDAAMRWAGKVAEGQAGSIAAARRLLAAEPDDLRAALEAERTEFIRQAATPEAMGGLARFLNIHPEESS